MGAADDAFRDFSLPPASHSAQRGKVLVVEDDQDTRHMLCLLLERDGYTVVAAANGKQGLSRFLNEPDIDLVLTDVAMPEGDGIGLAEAIRGLEASGGRRRTPIVVLSAHAKPSCVERALGCGADDFLAKPVRARSLSALLAFHVRGMRTVLVVEDDDLSRQAIERSLAAEGGLEVFGAASAEEALGLTPSAHFDVLLLDVQLPGMNGLELADELRKPGRPPPRILWMGGAARPTELADTAVYLRKPLRRQRLVEALRVAVAESGRPPARDAPAPPDAGPRLPPDCEIDPDMADLVEGYLASRLEDLARMRELLLSEQEGALREVRSLGHRMKGSGAAYGFRGLTELGALIEQAADAGDLSAVMVRVSELGAYLERNRI